MPRALPAEEVLEVARRTGKGPVGGLRCIPDAREAARRTIAGAERGDVICITGSFFTAGEIRARWQEQRPRRR
jgi:folylpolyglutamate synthase/dihydropteroate synthase